MSVNKLIWFVIVPSGCTLPRNHIFLQPRSILWAVCMPSATPLGSIPSCSRTSGRGGWLSTLSEVAPLAGPGLHIAYAHSTTPRSLNPARHPLYNISSYVKNPRWVKLPVGASLQDINWETKNLPGSIISLRCRKTCPVRCS